MTNDGSIQVLLVEQEPDTISVVSLFLSEIKECRLDISSSGEEALLKIAELKPQLVLFAYGIHGRNNLEVLKEIHQKCPSIYLIVSLPEYSQDLINSLMIMGANHCVAKDENYVTQLVLAVKKALIRISERADFPLSEMSRAQQFVIDENLPDIVFMLGLDGTILYVNRAISPILGYEPKDVVGQSFFELLANGESKSRFKSYIKRKNSDINFRGDLEIVNRLGLQEFARVNCAFTDGEYFYGVVRKQTDPGPLEMSSVAIEKEMKSGSIEVLPTYLGPYKITTLLGAGSMGRVYQAHDEHLDRPVAIKVLGKALVRDQKYIERFQQEAKILASISHPNIASIYYFGSLAGVPFFCMEYLSGGSLYDLLRKKGALDPDTAIDYTMQVALGLLEALEKGVLHMDIKPSNLMLARPDHLKIVDFGLARTKRELDEQSATIVGTPYYIAPEQFMGGGVDHRADIYSLGITLFQMLYGHVPFSGNKTAEVFQARLHQDLPPFGALNPKVSKRIYEIVSRMVAINPTDRFEKYSDLIQELQKHRTTSIGLSADTPAATKSTAAKRGMLSGCALPEILGEVTRKHLSGRLSLSWMDVSRILHFNNGNIVAILSNREGERFTDLLLENHELKSVAAIEIAEKTVDLFDQYALGMSSISGGSHERISRDLRELGWRVMENLFSWEVGEFVFEQGAFPAQLAMTIPVGNILIKGIKRWIRPDTIRRRLANGDIVLHLKRGFREILMNLKIAPGDLFLLFRFEDAISFRDLWNLCGIPEEEFYRLVYLFFCLGALDIGNISQTAKPGLRQPELSAP